MKSPLKMMTPSSVVGPAGGQICHHKEKEVRMQSYLSQGLVLELLHHGVHHQLLYVKQMIVTD